MVDRYAFARRRVARAIRRWSTGAVTLTRETPGEPDPSTPWVKATPTLDVYALSARVDGVAEEHIDGTTILASDLMVIASPRATHTLSGGEPADGAVADIEPRMTDTLTIDGAAKVIKKIDAIPAAGPAAMFHIFVAS